MLNGIDSIRKVIERLKARGDHEASNGYYGTLIENFTCDKKFYTCVEVTAGSRYLYSHEYSNALECGGMAYIRLHYVTLYIDSHNYTNDAGYTSI